MGNRNVEYGTHNTHRILITCMSECASRRYVFPHTTLLHDKLATVRACMQVILHNLRIVCILYWRISCYAAAASEIAWPASAPHKTGSGSGCCFMEHDYGDMHECIQYVYSI